MLAKLQVAESPLSWLNKLIGRTLPMVKFRSLGGGRNLCDTVEKEDVMAQAAEKRDTFFVRPHDPTKSDDRHPSSLRTETMVMPDGQRVHALERGAFDRAVKEAMTHRK